MIRPGTSFFARQLPWILFYFSLESSDFNLQEDVLIASDETPLDFIDDGYIQDVLVREI